MNDKKRTIKMKHILYFFMLCVILALSACSTGSNADSKGADMGTQSGGEADQQNEKSEDDVFVPEAIGNLPVMSITSNTSYTGVNTVYNSCTVSISGTSFDGIQADYEDLEAQIKIRGNSTAGRPKRPFKLKLSSKEDLFGMGKSRHWVLLANDVDHTHMRNILLNKLDYEMGSDVYIQSVSVDLYYNGEYVGIYQLCEQIRIEKNRVNIMDWDELAEDAAEAITLAYGYDEGFQRRLEAGLQGSFVWIDAPYEYTFEDVTYDISQYVEIPATTGGYILTMDFYAYDDDSVNKLVTAYRQPIYFDDPAPAYTYLFDNTSLYLNAKNYMQSFEYALHSDDFFFRNEDVHYSVADTGRWSNSQWKWVDMRYKEKEYLDDENDGKHYSELFDMDSLVNNFVFCEIAMNWDSMKNSVRFYKDIDGLAKVGPQWDFDWCWGNKNMYMIDTYYPEDWHTTIEYFTIEQFYQTEQFNRMLIRDPYFLACAYEKYHQIRPTLLEDMIKEGGEIDTYAEYLRPSAEKNDERWRMTYGSYRGEKFEFAVKSMNAFLDTRIAWLDTQFADFETFVDSLGYYHASDKLLVSSVTETEQGYRMEAEVLDPDICYITFQVNGKYLITAEVQNGTAVAEFASDCYNTEGVNLVEVKARNADQDYIYYDEYSKPGDYMLVISNYQQF